MHAAGRTVGMRQLQQRRAPMNQAIESRFYTVRSENRRPAGRSTVDIECPYCGVVTQARTWSLAGAGKRCDCGAVHHSPAPSSGGGITIRSKP